MKKINNYLRKPWESLHCFFLCAVDIWWKSVNQYIVRPLPPLSFFSEKQKADLFDIHGWNKFKFLTWKVFYTRFCNIHWRIIIYKGWRTGCDWWLNGITLEWELLVGIYITSRQNKQHHKQQHSFLLASVVQNLLKSVKLVRLGSVQTEIVLDASSFQRLYSFNL